MISMVVAILIFLVGVIAGYVASQYFRISNSKEELVEKLEQQENATALYKQEVAEHLKQSSILLEQMNSTCQTAIEQMAKSTELLQRATPEKNNEHIPFFSEETQKQLAETANERHEKRTSTQEQSDPQLAQPPLDYSGNPSGLFADQKQTVTNPE